MRRSTVLGLLTLVTVLCGSPIASGAEFTLKQCTGAGNVGMSGAYFLLDSDYTDVITGCNNGVDSKLGIYQDRSNRRIPFGNGGQFVWYTSGENEIVQTSISSKLNTRNGMEARLIGANNSDNDIALDAGSNHSGEVDQSRWTDRANPITVVAARLSCRPINGCENNSNSQKAFLELTDLEFTVRDTRPPTVGASGQLKNWGDDLAWHRGTASYSMSSSDQGSGLSRSYLKVNGSRFDSRDAVCPAAHSTYSTSFSPCPASFSYDDSVDTSISPFQEGLNTIQFCAEDYSITASAGVPTCTAERWVLVDSRPPDPPIGLQVDGGSDWRSTNDFDVRWTNPSGQYSPVVVAGYSIFDQGGNLVKGPTYVGGADIQSLDSIQVPAPGEYRLQVRLMDTTVNIGSAVSVTLRFDDGRPGNVAPENDPGWLSADELPLQQSIERAIAGGPSGVDGYAVSISKNGPGVPCPTGECSDAELTVAGGQDERTITIPDLSEGSHWISSVASSGAGLASEQPESMKVHVDKTDPVTSLAGAPTDWVNHPVTVNAIAADGGSGMTPGPGGDPVTVIEPAGQSPYLSPGSTAKFTIANEGATTVKYWARDLAGNANDGSLAPDGDRHRPPESTTIRIDTAPPSLSFETVRNASEPEMVAATVADRDSGVREARILYRRAGSTEQFTPIATGLKDGTASARLPSDEMERGSYEMRIEAADWAGNSTSSGLDSTGSPMVRNVPLKAEVSISSSLLKKEKPVRSLRLKKGGKARMAGRLITKSGIPVVNASLTVVESFAAGSSTTQRVSTTRTDGDGSYLVTLGKGPNRVVQVAYGGSPTLTKATGPELRVNAYDQTSLLVHPEVVRNGGTVKMTGRVRGPGALTPSKGKLIAIQYFDPSRAKWRPAEVLRTNRKGRYLYRYRFRTITSAQRIIFRTASLPEAGWPFLPSTSRPRSVIVYPKTGH